MKYILKKDLPFAKAGAEVVFNDKSLCFEVKSDRWSSDSGDYKFVGHSNKSSLIKDGWIEEVKPREWIIEVTKEQQYIRPADAKGRLYSSGSEIIKVREVINERNA